ncbi:MAG: hypothetical protein WC650_04300 [Candidatus Doudnabacteria bacterium]
MNKIKIALIAVILILLASNVFFLSRYFMLQKELQNARASIKAQQTDEKVLLFTKLFIKKVFKAQGEIDFETRLSLENSVRDLDDEKILEQWNKFTASKTETEAQDNLKDLLEMLVNKIRVQ